MGTVSPPPPSRVQGRSPSPPIFESRKSYKRTGTGTALVGAQPLIPETSTVGGVSSGLPLRDSATVLAPSAPSPSGRPPRAAPSGWRGFPPSRGLRVGVLVDHPPPDGLPSLRPRVLWYAPTERPRYSAKPPVATALELDQNPPPPKLRPRRPVRRPFHPRSVSASRIPGLWQRPSGGQSITKKPSPQTP